MVCQVYSRHPARGSVTAKHATCPAKKEQDADWHPVLLKIKLLVASISAIATRASSVTTAATPSVTTATTSTVATALAALGLVVLACFLGGPTLKQSLAR